VKTYNKALFKQIMVALDVYESLKSLKQSIQESFSDVIRGFLKLAHGKEEHSAWLIMKPVKEEVKPIWESELFD
jgi:predicted CopG family antitoxin